MRLTKKEKDNIKTLLVSRAFDERFKELQQRKALIGIAAIEAIWGADIYRLVQNLLYREPCAVGQTLGIRFHMSSECTYIEWQARHFGFDYPVPVKMVEGGAYTKEGYEIHDIQSEQVRTDVLAIIEEHAALFGERAKFTQEVHNLLYVANTYKQLYEMFPELQELAELFDAVFKHTVAKKSTALTLATDNLKKQLKLPSEQYGAAA